MRARVMVLMASALVSVLSGSTAYAQAPARVAISAEVGLAGGGPARDIEDAFTRAGLDDVLDTTGAFLSEGPLPHPVSGTPGVWSLDARVRVRPRVTVGVSLSSTQGWTDGYQEDQNFLDGYNPVSYTAEYSVRSVAPVISWHPSPRLRVGAGPAFHRITYSGSYETVRVSTNRLGLVGQAGFAWFSGRRLFSEVSAQYRTGSAIGIPGTSVSVEGSQGGGATVAIPATDLSYSHWSVGISFGVRVR